MFYLYDQTSQSQFYPDNKQPGSSEMSVWAGSEGVLLLPDPPQQLLHPLSREETEKGHKKLISVVCIHDSLHRGRNHRWPINELLQGQLYLHHNTPVQHPHHCRSCTSLSVRLSSPQSWGRPRDTGETLPLGEPVVPQWLSSSGPFPPETTALTKSSWLLVFLPLMHV